MSDTFLSVEEVGDLTGVLTGRRAKIRGQLQVEWLRTSRIPFWTNARRRPIISRSAIEGRPSVEQPRKKTVPAALALG